MPYGPCCICGATNYAMSMGGTFICPRCDCGLPPVAKAMEFHEKDTWDGRDARIVDLERQLAELQAKYGALVNLKGDDDEERN